MRVLLMADDCNPEWPSLPVVGFNLCRAIAEHADVVVVTHVRNRPNIVRAILGEAGTDSASTAEIALDVEKYVLPKFKVELNFASPEGKKKHGYRPGDHVSGTVQANYFFGKALDGQVRARG